MMKEAEIKTLVEIILNKSRNFGNPYPIKGKNKEEQINNLTAAIWIANRMQITDEVFEQAMIQYLHLID